LINAGKREGEREGTVAVASEPYDDDPRWTEVPDDTLLHADPGGVTITPLHDHQDLPRSPATSMCT